MKLPKTSPSPAIDLADLKRRVDLLWSRAPSLALPYKYGTELLEWDGYLLRLPLREQDVYQWSWRKVQQYYVNMLQRDPGDTESQVIRANVVGECRGRRLQREGEKARFDAMRAKLDHRLGVTTGTGSRPNIRFNRSNSHGTEAEETGTQGQQEASQEGRQESGEESFEDIDDPLDLF